MIFTQFGTQYDIGRHMWHKRDYNIIQVQQKYKDYSHWEIQPIVVMPALGMMKLFLYAMEEVQI